MLVKKYHKNVSVFFVCQHDGEIERLRGSIQDSCIENLSFRQVSGHARHEERLCTSQFTYCLDKTYLKSYSELLVHA